MNVLEAARRLEVALEELARALVAVSPDLVLRAEETLATAVTAFVSARREVPADPDTLRQALGAVRDAVTRCQALVARDAGDQVAAVVDAIDGVARGQEGAVGLGGIAQVVDLLGDVRQPRDLHAVDTVGHHRKGPGRHLAAGETVRLYAIFTRRYFVC